MASSWLGPHCYRSASRSMPTSNARSVRSSSQSISSSAKVRLGASLASWPSVSSRSDRQQARITHDLDPKPQSRGANGRERL